MNREQPDKKMRIALVGNMNNSNFALLRYMRDLGADAHLFLYSNEHAHFMPQVDTIAWEKWRPFVRRLPVSNGGLDAMVGDVNGVARALDGYDKFLGNGISPVLFRRMGRTLDVFVPYCEGVEFIAEFDPKWNRPVSAAFQWLRKSMMERALVDNVSAIVTANQHPSATPAYRRLGLSTVALPIIIKYDDETLKESQIGEAARGAIERMRNSSLAVFSQTQHRWMTRLGGPYPEGGKRNNWLIKGFAEYVQRSNDAKAVLVLLEYGPDVDQSKCLATSLGIDDQLIWLPMMRRLELLSVARHADVGADAFMGVLWGGTGWELISLGKPIIHYIENIEDYDWPSMSLPFFFNAHSPAVIAEVLLAHNRDTLRELGAKVRSWHERYQGVALAKRYLKLLETGDAPMPEDA